MDVLFLVAAGVGFIHFILEFGDKWEEITQVNGLR